MPIPTYKGNPEQGRKNRGGARPGSGPKAKNDPGRKLAIKLLNRPLYRAALEKKLDDMTIHPSVLVALFYYAYGKPKEVIETKDVTPVRIQHVYADDQPLPPDTKPEDVELVEKKPH